MAHADLISVTPSMHARRTIRTMCPMNCHPTLCGMLVDVEEGRLVDVRGDPDNPDSRGFLCVRGHARARDHRQPEAPADPADPGAAGGRRLAPRLVGRGARPDRLRMQAAGREAVGLWAGHGLFANNYGTRVGSHLLRRFANVWGCQWWNPTMICWGLGAFGLGLTGVLETNTKEDMGAARGSHPALGRESREPAEHRPPSRRGAPPRRHLVAIDVRETEAAGQADEVMPIRPGTDGALALAMMHVIVAEGAPRRRVHRGSRAGVRRARRSRRARTRRNGGSRHRHSRGAHRRPARRYAGRSPP